MKLIIALKLEGLPALVLFIQLLIISTVQSFELNQHHGFNEMVNFLEGIHEKCSGRLPISDTMITDSDSNIVSICYVLKIHFAQF